MLCQLVKIKQPSLSTEDKRAQRRPRRWAPRFFEWGVLSYCFCRAKKEGRFAHFLDALTHSINAYQIPHLPSIGLVWGNRWGNRCSRHIHLHTGECSEGVWVLRKRSSSGSGATEERRMTAPPQGLREPEGTFRDRIYWRVAWPIQILFCTL